MKKKVLMTALAVGVAATSVQNALAWKENGKTYEIPAGKHYAKGLNIGHFKGTSVTMSFRFDQSAAYTSRDPNNQFDANKLWGFTDCNRMDPQKDSARFSWRWLNNAVEILAQVDRNGQHIVVPLGTTVPFEMSHGTIRLSGRNYAFDYKGKTVLIPRTCGEKKMKGFRLYPYFGGQEPAPHDVTVFLQRGIHPSSVNPIRSLRIPFTPPPQTNREARKDIQLQRLR